MFKLQKKVIIKSYYCFNAFAENSEYLSQTYKTEMQRQNIKKPYTSVNCALFLTWIDNIFQMAICYNAGGYAKEWVGLSFNF